MSAVGSLCHLHCMIFGEWRHLAIVYGDFCKMMALISSSHAMTWQVLALCFLCVPFVTSNAAEALPFHEIGGDGFRSREGWCTCCTYLSHCTQGC